MAGLSKVTTDHNVIKGWVEARGGKPARVKRTGGNDDPGLLRVDFPGYSGKRSLEDIEWDEFFEKFDQKHLAFLYQDKMRDGQESRFFKLVSHETAENRDREAATSKHKNGARERGEATSRSR